MEPAIRVENLYKTYRLYKTPMDRLRERLPWNKKAGRTFYTPVHALQDINLEIEPGQCVGLIGGNGAGKSTLLKILNSTTFPTAGRYEVRGKVAALLELGAGFQANASGRANIFLNAALMGRSQEEMRDKYRQILDFSELHDFIKNPLKTYSSGMKARLGFSVAVATDPDVLIIDEILSVGDKHFRKKCVDKIMGFKEQGKTMFFCSHSLYDVRQICEKVIWLRNGNVEMFDDSVTVTNEYATFENQLASDTEKIPGRVVIAGELEPDRIDPEGQPRIVSANLVDPHTGEARHVFGPRDAVGVRVHVKNGKGVERLNMVVGFTRTDGTMAFAPATDMDGITLDFEDEAYVTLVLPDVRLLSGEFVVPVWLLDHRGVHRFHEKPTEVNLVVQNRDKELGLFYTDRRWEVEPVPSEEPAS